MKLIDILVQELPKRGGWPEGAECIKQGDSSGRMFIDEWCIGSVIFTASVIASDASEAGVTRKQYEAALAASKVPAWDGKGLPPVGAVCEVKRAMDWIECKILFISENHVVISSEQTDPREVCWHTYSCQFSPIRTEAERKREDAISAMLSKSCVMSEGTAYKIYEAIAAGEIPWVKLDDSTN